MDIVQIKKIVAICFLEAVKMSLDHLGAHRMSLAHDNRGSGELTRVYGEVRRLRDYLQRCTASYQDIAELELSGEDRGLLVACCRRYIEVIDGRLAGPAVNDAKERQFLLKKQQIIADWTVELAAKPLVEFPLPRLSESLGEGARALKTRLQHKLFALNEQSIISGGTMTPVGTGMPKHDHAPTATMGTVPVIDFSKAEVEGLETHGDPTFGSPTMLNEQLKQSLIDPNAVQDPRLRALVAMDLRSLGLAETGGDYRLTTVLMATILEAAVLDYAIPRGAELELMGGPETWHPQDILFKVLGEGASPSDRSFAYNLFYARKLLSPAQQLSTPMVATKASVLALRGFVETMLHQLGFAGSARNTKDSPR